MAEARVLTEDVRLLLRRVIRPDDPDEGEAVQIVAERAETSTRTIYRVIGGSYNELMSLDLADRLALASGGHLSDCRVIEPDERAVEYA